MTYIVKKKFKNLKIWSLNKYLKVQKIRNVLLNEKMG